MPFFNKNNSKETIQGQIRGIIYEEENYTEGIIDLLSENESGPQQVRFMGAFPAPSVGLSVRLGGSFVYHPLGHDFWVESCTLLNETENKNEKKEELRIKALIKKIIYSKDGFVVFSVGLDQNLSQEMGVAGDLVCTGYIPVLHEGTNLQLSGKLYNHPKYGTQFEVGFVDADVSDAASISQYLINYIDGVGYEIAKRIVERFGEETIDIFRNAPERLLEIEGVTANKLEKIKASFVDSQSFFAIFHLFGGEATATQVRKIYDRYGAKAVEKIKENPYVLINDVDGFGFKTADKLALALGMESTDTRRVSAALNFTLRAAQNEGHTFIYKKPLLENLSKNLSNAKISEELFEQCLKAEVESKNVIIDGYAVYHTDLYFAEFNVAKKIKKLIDSAQPQYFTHMIEKQLARAELIENIIFEPAQKEAIMKSLNNRVSVITGGAGTGKSTIINQLVKLYGAENVILLAPTGRAAKKMTEASNYSCLAQTIHRFVFSTFDEVNEKHFIIDESSMIDLALANLLFSKIALSSTIVFIGDVNQLPPIGAGMFFRDVIDCGYIPCTKLETSHRFGGLIAQNAEHIIQGNASLFDLKEGEDFKIVRCQDSELEQVILREFGELLKNYKIEEIQVVVPTRSKCTICAQKLNEALVRVGNPMFRLNAESFTRFSPGDRVINTLNTNENGEPICNGDCGFVDRIDEDKKVIYVTLDDGRRVEFIYGQNLELAYAVTAHKAQGAQYKAVIVVLGQQHSAMLSRMLLYTSVTRAREKLILIGDPNAIKKAIQNKKPVERRSKLLKRLERFFERSDEEFSRP